MNLDDIKGLRWESIKVEDMPDIPKCFSDWGSSAVPFLQSRPD